MNIGAHAAGHLADECWVLRIGQTVCNQPAAIETRTEQIQVTAVSVDGHVVTRARLRHCTQQGHHPVVHVGQINHLDAVPVLVGDHVGVVSVGLHVAPQAGRMRYAVDDDRVAWVRNLHDDHRITDAHQSVLAARRGDISPAVVSTGSAAKFVQVQPGMERNVVRFKLSERGRTDQQHQHPSYSNQGRRLSHRVYPHDKSFRR